MAYATVAELAEYLGLSDNLSAGVLASTEKTTRLSLALDAATSHIDNDTGRTFSSTTATKCLTPDGSYELQVPDLVSVTTLKIDTDANASWETTLSATNYELNKYHESIAAWPYEFIVRLDDVWPVPYANGRRKLVEIVGVWGWAATPEPIKQACLLLAGHLLHRANVVMGVQGFSDFGAFSVRNNDPDYRALIDTYKKPGIA